MQIPFVFINQQTEHRRRRKQISALRLKRVSPRQIAGNKNGQKRGQQKNYHLKNICRTSDEQNRAEQKQPEKNV